MPDLQISQDWKNHIDSLISQFLNRQIEFYEELGVGIYYDTQTGVKITDNICEFSVLYFDIEKKENPLRKGIIEIENGADPNRYSRTIRIGADGDSNFESESTQEFQDWALEHILIDSLKTVVDSLINGYSTEDVNGLDRIIVQFTGKPGKIAYCSDSTMRVTFENDLDWHLKGLRVTIEVVIQLIEAKEWSGKYSIIGEPIHGFLSQTYKHKFTTILFYDLIQDATKTIGNMIRNGMGWNW